MKNIAVLILCLYGCLLQGQQIADLRRHFDYDRSADLNVQIISTKNTMDAILQEILYSGGNGLTVSAYLVLPHPTLRQYPAVIFLHENGRDKSEFLSEAFQLSRESFASLLIDGPSARMESQPFTLTDYTTPDKDVQLIMQTILDVRRGIDFLQDNEHINRDRIGYVGIGTAAVSGAILAGLETRILTYVLIGCNPCVSCDLLSSRDPQIVHARINLTEEQINTYQTTLKYYDPIHYVGSHRGSILLYQFATSDPYYSYDKTKILMDATTLPVFQSSYPCTYGDLLSGHALLDRLTWFKDHL